MARVLAYLCNYWGIDYKTEVPGHQDIQADKIDPGNLLEACGYSRNVKHLDKQIAKYINGVKSSPSKKLSTKTNKKPTPSPQSVVKYKQAIEYMHSLKGQFVDFDNMYAYQCADLSVDFIYHVTGGVRFYGNAKELHTLNAMPKGWKVVKIQEIMFLLFALLQCILKVFIENGAYRLSLGQFGWYKYIHNLRAKL